MLPHQTTAKLSKIWATVKARQAAFDKTMTPARGMLYSLFTTAAVVGLSFWLCPLPVFVRVFAWALISESIVIACIAAWQLFKHLAGGVHGNN